VRFSGQTQRFFPVNLHLVCVHKFRLSDGLGSQELLGTGTARSTLSVVIPLDIGGHRNSKLMRHLSCVCRLAHLRLTPIVWDVFAGIPTEW
jgi:hypothetical protein